MPWHQGHLHISLVQHWYHEKLETEKNSVIESKMITSVYSCYSFSWTKINAISTEVDIDLGWQWVIKWLQLKPGIQSINYP